MARLTDYHEDYNKNFEEFESQTFYIPDYDLVAKTNLKFYKGRVLFNSTSSYNLLQKVSSSHKYKLSHQVRNSQTEFNHNSLGETNVEHENLFYQRPNYDLGAYFNMNLDQGEYRRNFLTAASLRYHHKDDLMLSLGVDNWDPLAFSPKNLTLNLSLGRRIKEKYKLSLNTYLSYSRSMQVISDAKFYVIGRTNDTNALIEIVNNNSVDNNVTIDEKNNSSNVSSHSIRINSRFNKVLNDKVVLGGNFSHDVNSKTSTFDLLGSFKIDRVKIISKLSSDRSLSLGINSVFDGIALNFGVKSKLGCKTDTLGERELTKHWIDYKFGFGISFDRV